MAICFCISQLLLLYIFTLSRQLEFFVSAIQQHTLTLYFAVSTTSLLFISIHKHMYYSLPLVAEFTLALAYRLSQTSREHKTSPPLYNLSSNFYASCHLKGNAALRPLCRSRRPGLTSHYSLADRLVTGRRT
jgi:hypothetical protein